MTWERAKAAFRERWKNSHVANRDEDSARYMLESAFEEGFFAGKRVQRREIAETVMKVIGVEIPLGATR